MPSGLQIREPAYHLGSEQPLGPWARLFSADRNQQFIKRVLMRAKRRGRLWVLHINGAW